MANVTKFTVEKRAEFLEAYRELGTIKHAAERVGISRRTVYRASDCIKSFRLALEQAKEDVADTLEKEAMRRAAEGVEEPVFYRGIRVGTVRKYSDTLLIFLLKGLRPDKFRENRRTELTGVGGGPLIFKVVFDDDNGDR